MNLWLEFQDDYSGTILIIESNFGKEIVFFIPSKLEKTYNKKTDK